MKIIKKPWFIPIVLTFVILAVGGYYIKHLLSDAETLSEAEIREQLEEAYGGKVERLSLEGTTFEVELSRNKDAYLAMVDAETGKVLSLIQTKEVVEEELPIASVENDGATDDKEPVVETKNTEPVVQGKVEKVEATPAPAPTPKKTQPEPAKPVAPEAKPKTNTNQATPPKAATTVLISEKQAVKIALGQLKGEVEDVEFVKTKDGGYYLVEIDDNEDDEATFQIHAISGKILSVTWDD